MLQNMKNPSFLLRSITLALVFALPWFFLPLAWVGVLQSKMLAIAVLVALFVIVLARRAYVERRISIPSGPLVYAVIALPIVYAISALLSGARAPSLVSGMGENDTLGAIVLFAALFMAAAGTLSDAVDRRAFFRAAVLGSLVLMIVQVLHVLVPALSLGVLTAAAANIFGAWHEVGIVAGLSIFMCAALWDTPILRGAWLWIGVALAALSVFMLLVVNMVDVWFVFGALMLAYTAYLFLARSTMERSTPRILIAATIGVASIAAGFFASQIYSSLPQRLQVLQIEVRPSWAGTFEIGRESMTGVRSALLGSGPNTFSRQWSLYKPVGINQTEFWDIDFRSGVGFIPTTFVTVGILGLAAWAALLICLLLYAAKRVRSCPRDAIPEAIVLTGTTLYLAIYHIIYVPSVTLSALAFLMLGAYASYATSRVWGLDRGDATRAAYLRIAGTVIVLLGIVAACVWTVRATVSDVLVNKSAIAFNRQQDAQAALSHVQRALLVYPHNERAHRAAVELGLVRMGELAAAGEQTAAALQASLEASIQHGLAAISISDGGYQNWLALAVFYRELAGAGVDGAYENARAAYERAYTDNPKNPVPLVQAAQLEMAQDNMAGALALLSEAAALKPDLAAMRLLRSQVYLRQGNVGLAIADAIAVTQILPEDPLAWLNLGTVYYESKKFDDAVLVLERAAALRADFSDALYLLGLSYAEVGRSADAQAALARVVELNPGNPQAVSALERVKTLPPTGAAR